MKLGAANLPGLTQYYVDEFSQCAPGFTAGNPANGFKLCTRFDMPASSAPAAPAAPVTVTVSPTISSQVSPQVSPVLQQQFQPSNSPASAGTAQSLPTQQGSPTTTTTTQAAPTGPSVADIQNLLAQQHAQDMQALQAAMTSAAGASQQPITAAPAPMATLPPLDTSNILPPATTPAAPIAAPAVPMQTGIDTKTVFVILGIGTLAYLASKKRKPA